MTDKNTATPTPKQKIKFGEKAAFCVGEVFGGGGVVLLDAFFFTMPRLSSVSTPQ